jgi:D-3-phosphoglycerate dehydrogenase
MLAMGMTVNAFDPFFTAEKAESLGVNLVDLDTIITESDFITVHTPLTAETKGLFGAKEFARMKKGVRLVNCARGGIYDEVALAEAIQSGKVAGAAIDVYPVEPPTERALIDLPQTVVTPHLGASTVEAQENVAIDVAVEVIKVLKGESFKNAVNLPPLRPEVRSAIQPYTGLVEELGKFIAQLVSGRITKLEINYMGEVSKPDTSYLSLLFVKGLLQASLGDEVTPVNALVLAKERGLKVNEIKTEDVTGYASLIKVVATTDSGKHTLTGTIIENGAKVVEIEGYHFDLVPSGNLIVVNHTDQPGIIGEVGTVLGASGVNIASMQVGRKVQGGTALMVLTVDAQVDDEILKRLEKVTTVTKAHAICL